MASTVHSSAQGRQSANVLPEILTARRQRITATMLGQMRANTSSTNRTLFRGVGIYTHAEVAAPEDAPRFPHQRYTAPDMRLELMPLSGPRREQKMGQKRPELPKEVLDVYEEMKAMLLQEEKLNKAGKGGDPRERFECLGLPEIMVPPPPSIPPPEHPDAIMLDVQEIGAIRKEGISDTQEMGEICEYVMTDTQETGEICEESDANIRKGSQGDALPNSTRPLRWDLPPREQDSEDSSPSSNPNGKPIMQASLRKSSAQAMFSPLKDAPMNMSSNVDVHEPPSKASTKIPMKLRCSECGANFYTSLRDLVAHFIKYHSYELDAVFYECCSEGNFKATSASAEHMRDAHGWYSDPFPCFMCPHVFVSLPDVRDHFKKMHNSELLQVAGPPPQKQSTQQKQPPRAPSPNRTPPTPKPPQPAESAQQRPPPQPKQSPPQKQTNKVPHTPNPKTPTPRAAPRHPLPQNLSLRCLKCKLSVHTIPALTLHLLTHHIRAMPKIWAECCELKGKPLGQFLTHIAGSHGWTDALPCPVCRATINTMPNFHGHIRGHVDALPRCEPCDVVFVDGEAEGRHVCADKVPEEEKKVSRDTNKLPPPAPPGTSHVCKACTQHFTTAVAKAKHDCPKRPGLLNKEEDAKRVRARASSSATADEPMEISDGETPSPSLSRDVDVDMGGTGVVPITSAVTPRAKSPATSAPTPLGWGNREHLDPRLKARGGRQ